MSVMGCLASSGGDVGLTLLSQHFSVEVRVVPRQLFSYSCSEEVGFVEVEPSFDELSYYFFCLGGHSRDYCFGAFRSHIVTLDANVIQ